MNENEKKPNLLGIVSLVLWMSVFFVGSAKADIAWLRKSSVTGDMPIPNDGIKSEAAIVSRSRI